MNEQNKAPLQENTKDDSSDIERVKKDKERLENEGAAPPRAASAPPEPDNTKEAEESEKGHA